MKKKRDACGEDEGRIFPDSKCSSMNLSVAFHLSGERGYTLPPFRMNESFMFISRSYGREGGRVLDDGSSKIFLKVEYSGSRETSGCFWVAASSRAWDILAMVEAWRNLDLHRTMCLMAYAVCALWQNSSGAL